MFFPRPILRVLRTGEATDLRWSQVNLINRWITVGRAKKSSATGRVIPINDEWERLLIRIDQ
jgi:integrase